MADHRAIAETVLHAARMLDIAADLLNQQIAALGGEAPSLLRSSAAIRAEVYALGSEAAQLRRADDDAEGAHRG